MYSTPTLRELNYHVKKFPRPISNAVSAASERCRRVDHALSELKTLGRHSGDVWAVAITPDRLKAISASPDQTLKLWDLTSGTELKTLTGHTDKVIAVAVTAQGRIAISGSVDNTLKLWDLTIGTELKTLTGHTDYIKAIAITWEGPAGYGRDVTIALWMLER